MRRRCGFTLIELICVVAIMGVVFAMAALRLDYLVPKYKLRGGAREVGALLKQSQYRAASAGRDIYVQIEVGQGRYSLLAPFAKLNPDGTPKEPAELEYQPVFRRALPEGVEFVDVILGTDQKTTSGRALVRMSPFGASSHVIVNLRLGDSAMAVKLNGLTGVLSFQDAYTNADALIEDQGE